MTEVAQGTSLARFGHGELLIMAAEDAEHQKYDGRLWDELRLLRHNSPCLVAVPPNDPPGWEGFLDNYGGCLDDDRWYGSSFVSRHDWVPWTEEYRKVLYSLWHDRTVSLVASKEGQLPLKKLVGAKNMGHVEAPSLNAFDRIDYLESQAETIPSDIVILSCGPTGTVLADRLARKGIWAVDLGNFWKFL